MYVRKPLHSELPVGTFGFNNINTRLTKVAVLRSDQINSSISSGDILRFLARVLTFGFRSALRVP